MTRSTPVIEKIRRLSGRDEDGGAIAVIFALGLTVLLGSAALAIDLGHLMNVRTESQRVADLAALAGASAFIDAPGATLTSVIDTRAKQYAALNDVNQSSVVLTSADIQIDIPEEKVRVTVHHTQTRGNPIQTIFARILGINSVDVVTTAVAKAYPAGGARCILPFFLPDQYSEGGGDPNLYDLAPPDYYEPYDPTVPSPTATGYTEANVGDLLIIKGVPGAANPSNPNPSWYYPIRAYDVPGASQYRDAIQGCVDPEEVYAIGDLVEVQPGAIPGPTRQGFDALIAQAPSHAWHVANECVVDTAAPDPTLCLGGSPRLRPVPMMAPPDAPPPGVSVQVPIMNWASVFVESRQGDEVFVRFAGYSGVLPIEDPDASLTGLPKIIRLVE